MKIPVIKTFKDRINKELYQKNKSFPSENTEYELTKERLKELLTKENKISEPVIAINKSMLADDLKAIADLLEIEYDSKATKDDLVKLIEGV